LVGCLSDITILQITNEVAIADYSGHRVTIFNAESGAPFVRNFGEGGKEAGEGKSSKPVAIAFDSQDNILLLEYNTGELQICSSEGVHLVTRVDLNIHPRDYREERSTGDRVLR
jgi:hypothetical protein